MPKAKPTGSKADSTASLSPEADLVVTALRGCAVPQSEATPQILLRSREANKAKNNMAALSGQLFYSTQIPVCLWFSGKNEPAGKCRAVSELELASAA